MRIATKKGDARLEAIARAVRALVAPFACGGKLALDGPVELRLGKKRVRIAEEPFSQTLGETIARVCRPAPFGDGATTRRDKSVRAGLHLLARDGELEVFGLPLDTILSETRRALCPNDARPPVAELYGINVYRRGGHFVSHKDTPRDPTVFGTLVVRLPIAFGGGRLLVKHTATRVFDWADRFSFRDPSPLSVDWAAFYGDVDHLIEPVTSGTRVTLTWNLRRDGTGEAEDAGNATAADDALADALVALHDEGAMRGRILAVPCTHLYTETEGSAPAPAFLEGGAVGALKGRDRRIAEIAMRLGLRTWFRPYLFEDCAGDCWQLARPLNARDLRVLRRRRLTPDDMEALPIAHSAVDLPGANVTWVLDPPWMSSYLSERPDVVAAEQQLVTETEYSATGYFGNESSDVAFYVSGALLLEIAPRAARAARTAPGTVPSAPPALALRAVRGRGARKTWVMEQVVPVGGRGAKARDPIGFANTCADAGDVTGARAVLAELLARDSRCIDAHAHLGALAFDDDPAAALAHYEAGVAVGDRTVASDFDGHLPWRLEDNQPFMRCLDGVAMCAWRHGDLGRARAVFERLARLDPSDDQDVAAALDAVRRGVAWDDAS